MKPTVLIVTTARWFPTARLAVALANAGFTVDAVCPSHHPITETDAVRRIYKYDGLDALTSVAEAINGAKPDVVVPGDDLATQHLHLLYDQELDKGDSGASICALVERSLGSPENFPTLYARTKFMELAQEEGVRVPRPQSSATTANLKIGSLRWVFPRSSKLIFPRVAMASEWYAMWKTPNGPCAFCRLLLFWRER